MIKNFVVWLLGMGMIPILATPMASKITPDDSLSAIRYKIKQSGLRRNDIARDLNLSIDCVNKTLAGKLNNKLNTIIKYVNRRIS